MTEISIFHFYLLSVLKSHFRRPRFSIGDVELESLQRETGQQFEHDWKSHFAV